MHKQIQAERQKWHDYPAQVRHQLSYAFTSGHHISAKTDHLEAVQGRTMIRDLKKYQIIGKTKRTIWL